MLYTILKTNIILVNTLLQFHLSRLSRTVSQSTAVNLLVSNSQAQDLSASIIEPHGLSLVNH